MWHSRCNGLKFHQGRTRWFFYFQYLFCVRVRVFSISAVTYRAFLNFQEFWGSANFGRGARALPTVALGISSLSKTHSKLNFSESKGSALPPSLLRFRAPGSPILWVNPCGIWVRRVRVRFLLNVGKVCEFVLCVVAWEVVSGRCVCFAKTL